MKNTFRLKAIQRIAGIIALAAIIGFSFTACGDGDGGGGGGSDAFTGTWVGTSSGMTLKFVAANGSFKQYMVTSSDIEVVRGTYTVSVNTVSATITEVNTIMFGGADTWVAYANLNNSYQGFVGAQNRQFTISNNSFTEQGTTFTKQQ